MKRIKCGHSAGYDRIFPELIRYDSVQPFKNYPFFVGVSVYDILVPKRIDRFGCFF